MSHKCHHKLKNSKLKVKRRRSSLSNIDSSPIQIN